jgi:hypothetical protein
MKFECVKVPDPSLSLSGMTKAMATTAGTGDEA